jgi:hypothetical protein
MTNFEILKLRSLIAGSLLCLPLVCAAPDVRAAPQDGADDGIGPALVRQMVGTWSVQQWMWPTPTSEAIALPPAVAHRLLIGDGILQETMTTGPGAAEPFTRVAYFDYNTINRQYEYFSLDTRAPQMMNERSVAAANDSQSDITLYGGIFVAPQWGPVKNAAFRYRLVVGAIADGRQKVELYLTPLSGDSVAEFLAFRYVYTRQN